MNDDTPVQVQLRGGPFDRKVVTVPYGVVRRGYIRMLPSTSPLLQHPPKPPAKPERVFEYKVEPNPHKLVAYLQGDEKP